MTKQEAINRIKEMMEAIEAVGGISSDDWEALDMAVDSLSDDWIPTKRGLPEQFVDVLTSSDSIPEPWVEIQHLEGDAWEDRQGGTQEMGGVQAWRPLPKGYRRC